MKERVVIGVGPSGGWKYSIFDLKGDSFLKIFPLNYKVHAKEDKQVDRFSVNQQTYVTSTQIKK